MVIRNQGISSLQQGHSTTQPQGCHGVKSLRLGSTTVLLCSPLWGRTISGLSRSTCLLPFLRRPASVRHSLDI